MKRLMMSGLLGHYASMMMHSMPDSDRGTAAGQLIMPTIDELQQTQSDHMSPDIGQMTQGNTGKQTVVAPQQGGMPDISAGPGIGVSEWHDGPPAAGIDPNQADMQYS